jgi:hypothetical protein
MTFIKDLTKFVNSKQCKMIGCIFLVLLISILIKLSMPDTFEHLNYSFKLKFSKQPPTPDDIKITDFNFKIDDKEGTINEGDSSTEIEFSDMTEPTGQINLVISGKTDSAKGVVDKLKIAGNTSNSSNGDDYTFILDESDYKSGKEIEMTDQ